MTIGFGVISYTLSGAAFLVFALLLAVGWKRRIEGVALLLAAVFQVIWSALLALHTYHPLLSEPLLFLIESMRSTIWVVFIMRLITIDEFKRLPVALSLAIVLTITLSLLFSILNLFFNSVFSEDTSLSMIFLLILSVLGIVLSEQLYRNVKPERRWSVKYLCIGLAVLFIYDLYLYSDAVMFSSIDPVLWQLRGLVNTAIVPMLALSAARNPKWSFNIFVSRQVVFYSTGLLSIGAYLTLMAIGGYYIQLYGGKWGGSIQFVFFLGAVFVLFLVLSSKNTRTKIKIFLTKHFYKNKYDYREEWLKLIHKISEYKSPDYLYEQIIQAMSELIQSQGGHLFVIGDEGYVCVKSWNSEKNEHVVPLQSSLAIFLNKYEWVIDIPEFLSDKEDYRNLQLPDWMVNNKDLWLVIPLKHQYQLLGFVLLHKSFVYDRINWEDRDLLKAVGRQISSYLALIRTSEELNEAQQFSAFNKLSSFVVHDLKNQVAQLALVVKNSETYKDNPEFVSDAMLTVDNVVKRMQKLLSQLKKVKYDASDSKKVSVKAVLLEAIEHCSLARPQPELESSDSEFYVHVEEERFVNVIEHLIQNAQEATDDTGVIAIKLEGEGDYAVISITDSGSGMDESFIRTRLFRPFDSTKGNAGMGIGVFEAKEFVKFHEGKLEVQSKPDEGTTFTIKLPCTAGRE